MGEKKNCYLCTRIKNTTFIQQAKRGKKETFNSGFWRNRTSEIAQLPIQYRDKTYRRRKMKTTTRAIVCAFGAVICWSTVATAFKIALATLSVYEMLLVSCPVAMLIVAALLSAERKWALLKQLSKREWVLCALSGLVNPLAYYLVLFAAYDHLPAHIAQPLNYLWPIILMFLLAAINRQKIPALKYVGMAVSLTGVAVISFGSSSGIGSLSVSGICLGVASALIWAAYWLINDKMKRSIDSAVMLFLAFAFGTCYLAAGTAWTPVRELPLDGLLAGMFIGAMEMGIPFILFSQALRDTDNPALVNQLCYLAPFISLFLIAFILHEEVMPVTFLGLALIVGGIVYNRYVPHANKK